MGILSSEFVQQEHFTDMRLEENELLKLKFKARGLEKPIPLQIKPALLII